MKSAVALVLLLAAPAARGQESADAEMGRRVQELLRAHQADVFGCVRSAPAEAHADGELLVRVFVGEGGRAERPQVLKDQSGSGAIGRCLVDKVKAWDLTALGAAAGDQIVFPLAFKPESPRVKEADLRPLPIAGGRASARLFLDGRDAPVAFDKLIADKGVTIPPHRHDASDEIIYVLAGRGTTTVAGKRFPVEPGDLVHIPKGVEHSLTVEEKLTAVQVYAPGGPEQRFKQGSR